MKTLVLGCSPRRDGNSNALAEAALEGGRDVGQDVEYLHLADLVTGMLDDGRVCLREDGTCSIVDGYERLLLEKVLPADGLVFATPLYWYGCRAGSGPSSIASSATRRHRRRWPTVSTPGSWARGSAC